jgi:hypothetical protein
LQYDELFWRFDDRKNRKGNRVFGEAVARASTPIPTEESR